MGLPKTVGFIREHATEMDDLRGSPTSGTPTSLGQSVGPTINWPDNEATDATPNSQQAWRAPLESYGGFLIRGVPQ